MTEFKDGTAFEIDGYDRYETPEECLVEFVWGSDAYQWHGEALASEAKIRSLGSVTVHTFRAAERAELDVDTMSDDMLTSFEEAYADENLDIGDNIDNLKDHDAYRRCKQAIQEALATFQATLPVTAYEDKPCAERTYTPDEVVEIVREQKPQWFREVG